jgi:hypothetical protein
MNSRANSDGRRNFISSSHLGLPLTPGLAREIIVELFRHQPQWITAELIVKVPQEHRRRGGIDGKDTIKNVINKALGYLKEDGYIQRKAYGFWEWIGGGPDAGDLAAVPPPAVSPDDKIKIGKTLGNGPESVYIYYYDAERELANFKGHSTWPCKIGNAGEPVSRILNQTKTARHTLPVIALAIRSDDAEEVERLIHRLLRRAGSWINNDHCGDEWFMTTPEQVAACYSGIENLVLEFSPTGGEPHGGSPFCTAEQKKSSPF